MFKQKQLIRKVLCSLAFMISLSTMLQAISASPANYTLQAADVTINNGVITACSYDFASNTYGTNLTIPENLGVTGIVDAETDIIGNVQGNPPFNDKNIMSIQLPSTLVNIGDYAFADNNIKTLTLPSGVKNIGRDAFFSNNIDTLRVPSTVETIGMNSFHSNLALDTVIFENGSHLVNIGSHAFVNTRVSTIKLPTPIIDGSTFEYWIKFDTDNTTYSGGDVVDPDYYQFSAKYDYTLTSDDLTIENGLITACSYNFNSKFIIIPSVVDGKTITGIKDASSQKDGIFYGKTLLELTLPETLETIGDFAFNANSIDTLVIPSSVTQIGRYAFWGFELDTVIFESNSKLESLGYMCFDNNSDLKMSFPTPEKDGYTFDNWEDDNTVDIYAGGDEITDFKTSYTAAFSLINSISSIEVLGGVNIYPNPNNGNFNIELAEGYTVDNVVIYNSIGKVIYSSNVVSSISLGDVLPGIYFVNVYGSNEVKSVKMIIE